MDLTFNNRLRVIGELVGHSEDSIQVRVDGGKVYKIRLALLTKESIIGLSKQIVTFAASGR